MQPFLPDITPLSKKQIRCLQSLAAAKSGLLTPRELAVIFKREGTRVSWQNKHAVSEALNSLRGIFVERVPPKGKSISYWKILPKGVAAVEGFPMF